MATLAERLRALAQKVEYNVNRSWPIELAELPEELNALAAEVEGKVDPIQRLWAMSAQFREILAKLYASPNYRMGEKLASVGVHYEIGTFGLSVNERGVSARLNIGSGGDDSPTLQFYHLFHDKHGTQNIDCWWGADTLEELVTKIEAALLPVLRGFDERKAKIEMREREMRRLNWEIQQLAAGNDLT